MKLTQEEFIKEFNEYLKTDYELDRKPVTISTALLFNFITHLLEKREGGVSVSDEEIELVSQKKWQDANNLYSQQGGINPTPYMYGWKHCAKWLQSEAVELLKACEHPKEMLMPYHDSSILCDKCGCIIEQFGKKVEPPYKL